eukprot:1398139-Pyramimonas_sp.AAC.1
MRNGRERGSRARGARRTRRAASRGGNPATAMGVETETLRNASNKTGAPRRPRQGRHVDQDRGATLTKIGAPRRPGQGRHVDQDTCPTLTKTRRPDDGDDDGGDD